jgi:hypothetical protein
MADSDFRDRDDDYERIPVQKQSSTNIIPLVVGIGCAVLAVGAVVAVVCVAAILTLGQNASGTFYFTATKVSST